VLVSNVSASISLFSSWRLIKGLCCSLALSLFTTNTRTSLKTDSMADTENKDPLTGTVSIRQCIGRRRSERADLNTALQGEAEPENDPQFEPVIKLEQQVETKTHEEDEDVLFKM
jgi:hypothetical protein